MSLCSPTGEQFEELRFAHPAPYLFQNLPLGIGDDGGWRGADLVTTQCLGRRRIIQVNHHRNEPRVDQCHHLLVRPNVAFHDSTGNAPCAGEEEDDGLAGFGSLLLSRRIIASPNDVAVEGDVEAIPSVAKGDYEECKPKPAPEIEGLGSTRL